MDQVERFVQLADYCMFDTESIDEVIAAWGLEDSAGIWEGGFLIRTTDDRVYILWEDQGQGYFAPWEEEREPPTEHYEDFPTELNNWLRNDLTG